jgi:cobalt-zinc-cadmium efflux system protein
VSVLAKRKATVRHTYGLRSATILGALANAMLLPAAIGAVSWEAVNRLREPEPAQGLTMLAVAAVGIVINGASALMFLRGQARDANVRAAFLHLTADAAVSVGVVVAGLVIWKTSWAWVDPLASLLISAVVLVGTWDLLRQALHLAVAGVPRHIDLVAVKSYLASLPGVCAVHDLHIWAMSTTEVAMTAHLVMPWTERPPDFLTGLPRELHERFDIDHSTVQIEPLEAEAACPQGGQSTI